MYLHSSIEETWNDCSMRCPRFGEARPNHSGLLFAVAACRWLQIFYHTGNAVEREGCIVRFDSSIDTRVGYNDWLQTMKHALRSIALFLPGLGLQFVRVNLATCDVETINILTDFCHFTRFPDVSSFVRVFMYHLNEADSETS